MISSEMDTHLWISSQFLILLFTLTLIYLYLHFTKLRRFGIPGPTPWPIFGNLLQQLIRGKQNTDEEWFRKYGKVYGMYNGFRPTIVVSDLNIIKSILVKDFSNFTDRAHSGNLPKLLSNGLFFMQGQSWKRTRQIITPTFSAGKLKKMIPAINKCAETLADNLGALAGEQNVVVREYFVNFTMDAIASTVFGLDVDSQKQRNDPFVKNMDPVFSIRPLAFVAVIISALAPGIGRILYRLGISPFPKKSIQFYEDVGQALIDDRRKNKMSKVDFLQLLIDAEFDESMRDEHDSYSTKRGTTIKLSDDEINGQAFVFFLAGFETTASFLRYGSYVLALHPEIDEKLYSEIQKYIGKDEPTYENIGQLKYMDQFVHEVLRCYPPVHRLIRVTKETMIMDGITIPKGSSIQIPVWNIHYNAEHYENPEKFDPDRFAQDRKCSTENVTFLAFGIGPRHCIGMRLALLEAKVALVHILRKVRFMRTDHTKVPLELTHFAITLRAKTPVVVGILNR